VWAHGGFKCCKRLHHESLDPDITTSFITTWCQPLWHQCIAVGKWVVKNWNICPSHDLLMFIFFLFSLGASYKTFAIPNSENLEFWSFLSILESSYRQKKKIKLIFVFLTMIIIIVAGYGSGCYKTNTTVMKYHNPVHAWNRNKYVWLTFSLKSEKSPVSVLDIFTFYIKSM
jgi:hypothetical protein